MAVSGPRMMICKWCQAWQSSALRGVATPGNGRGQGRGGLAKQIHDVNQQQAQK